MFLFKPFILLFYSYTVANRSPAKVAQSFAPTTSISETTVATTVPDLPVSQLATLQQGGFVALDIDYITNF